MHSGRIRPQAQSGRLNELEPLRTDGKTRLHSRKKTLRKVCQRHLAPCGPRPPDAATCPTQLQWCTRARITRADRPQTVHAPDRVAGRRPQARIAGDSPARTAPRAEGDSGGLHPSRLFCRERSPKIGKLDSKEDPGLSHRFSQFQHLGAKPCRDLHVANLPFSSNYLFRDCL